MEKYFNEAMKDDYNDLKKYGLSPEIGKSLFLLLYAPSDKDFEKHGYTSNDITQEEFPTMFQQGIPWGCNPVGCAKVSIKGTEHAEQVKSFFELVKTRKEEEKLIEEDERAFGEEDNAARKIQKAFRNKSSQQAKKMAETKEKSKN